MTKHPNHSAKRAIRASLAFLALFLTATTLQARSGVVFGTTADRLTCFTRLGMVETLSDNLSVFIPVDLGDSKETAAALPLFTVYIDHTFTLGVMLGPEVTIKADSLTLADKITYLQAATGAIGSWNLHHDLSIWSSFQLTAGDLPAPALKIGFGLIAWID